MEKDSQQAGIIPLFPLPSTVFYPSTPLPLHIFEPRYRQMTADALEGERKIGMVLLKPDWEENYFDKPTIYPIGCVGSIEKEIRHLDGKYNFTLVGLRRFRIVKEVKGKLYRCAEINLLEEQNEQVIGEEPNTTRDGLNETLFRHAELVIFNHCFLAPEGYVEASRFYTFSTYAKVTLTRRVRPSSCFRTGQPAPGNPIWTACHLRHYDIPHR